MIIPLTSQPQFGNYLSLNIKERNINISDFIINFNLSSITGIFGAPAHYPHFSPATFWLSKVKLVVKNVTIDTLYPVLKLVSHQFIYKDKIRFYINNMKDSYNSLAQITTLASTAGQNYCIKLRTF